jgi:hypothetical protein
MSWRTLTHYQIFDISIHEVKNWGYIYPGTLFGWQDTGNEPSNSPFWRPGTNQSLVDPDDPYRKSFSAHCFTLLRNSLSEEKVIDVCLAMKDDNPEAEYSTIQHLFQDGWCDLESYKAHTDKGRYMMQQGNLEGMLIELQSPPSVSFSILTD